MTPRRVFVVDDDAAVRDATALFLKLNGLPSETFASGQEFLDAYRHDWIGCVLLDLKMPGVGGLEVQQALASRRSLLQVVLVTAHGDVRTTRAALKAGAFDFLEKPVENSVLLDVVRQALATDRSTGTGVSYPGELPARVRRLTARERQVMDLLVEGKQNRDIAITLGISPRTVEVYKARMMEKLQVQTLADLIRFVLGGLKPPAAP